MMNERKASVLLDLDDTILDFKKAERIAISKTFLGIGIEPTDEVVSRYSEINIMQWEKLELGLVAREDALRDRFDILFKEIGVDYPGIEAERTYEKLLEIGHYFMPGAEETLRAIYEKYDLYIVSHGLASVQDSRLRSAGISYMFKDIFISERIGFQKPDREFFDRCFARIPGFERGRSVIVGDSLTSDIRGGMNAGITTCWYDPYSKPLRDGIVPDYRITAMPELPALLERLFG